MNNNSSNKSGISFWTKDDYARKYFTRRPIRHQRCIGVTDYMLEEIKDVVNLIAMGGTTVRAYVSAIIADHLKEFKFLHEYMRRAMYNKLLVGDPDKFQPTYEKYAEQYLQPVADIVQHTSRMLAEIYRGHRQAACYTLLDAYIRVGT